MPSTRLTTTSSEESEARFDAHDVPGLLVLRSQLQPDVRSTAATFSSAARSGRHGPTRHPPAPALRRADGATQGVGRRVPRRRGDRRSGGCLARSLSATSKGPDRGAFHVKHLTVVPTDSQGTSGGLSLPVERLRRWIGGRRPHRCLTALRASAPHARPGSVPPYPMTGDPEVATTTARATRPEGEKPTHPAMRSRRIAPSRAVNAPGFRGSCSTGAGLSRSRRPGGGSS